MWSKKFFQIWIEHPKNLTLDISQDDIGEKRKKIPFSLHNPNPPPCMPSGRCDPKNLQQIWIQHPKILILDMSYDDISDIPHNIGKKKDYNPRQSIYKGPSYGVEKEILNIFMDRFSNVKAHGKLISSSFIQYQSNRLYNII